MNPFESLPSFNVDGSSEPKIIVEEQNDAPEQGDNNVKQDGPSANSAKENKDHVKSDKADSGKKSKQEYYVKNDITSKGDYKIRKKLDAADALLEKVRFFFTMIS